jgi:hypothetical protein
MTMTSNAWKKKDDAKKKHLDQKIPIQGKRKKRALGMNERGIQGKKRRR